MEPTQGKEGNFGGGNPCRELDPCSECRYMVVGIIPLVQKGHPCRELNPTGNWNHAGNTVYMGPCCGGDCVGSFPCIGPHHSQLPTFTAWFPAFTAWPSSHLYVILTQPEIFWCRHEIGSVPDCNSNANVFTLRGQWHRKIFVQNDIAVAVWTNLQGVLLNFKAIILYDFIKNCILIRWIQQNKNYKKIIDWAKYCHKHRNHSGVKVVVADS